MYIHIGQDTVIVDEEIIGIFDMENTTVMKSTVDYLNKAEKDGNVNNVAPFELPKSFVVTNTKKEKKEPIIKKIVKHQNYINLYVYIYNKERKR